MYCKHCGKQIDDNSKFCKFCGKQLVESQNIEISFKKPQIFNKLKSWINIIWHKYKATDIKGFLIEKIGPILLVLFVDLFVFVFLLSITLVILETYRKSIPSYDIVAVILSLILTILITVLYLWRLKVLEKRDKEREKIEAIEARVRKKAKAGEWAAFQEKMQKETMEKLGKSEKAKFMSQEDIEANFEKSLDDFFQKLKKNKDK